MPTQPTTRAQISGYNFLVRRMEHAIVRRDVRMLFDPMRSQSRAFTVGIVLATLVMAGAAVLALFRPQDKMGDHKVVVGKDTGAMYVVVGDIMHPVLNLASARLAAGNPDKPAVVKESELSKHPRGQLIGIPGAPSAMPFDKNGKGTTWTVCDKLRGSSASEKYESPMVSVIVGAPELGDNAAPLHAPDALLLKSRSGTTYLAYGGVKAVVDNDPAVVNAMGLDGFTARSASDALINAIPSVPDIRVPKLDRVGTPPGFNHNRAEAVALPSDVAKIGWIIQDSSKQNYLVLDDGIQAVTAPTANLIIGSSIGRATGQAQISTVPPSVTYGAPHSTSLDNAVSKFPKATPRITNIDKAPVGCLSWKPVGTASDRQQNTISAELTLIAGISQPVAESAKAVPVIHSTGAARNTSSDADESQDTDKPDRTTTDRPDRSTTDKAGDRADVVFIKPGSGAFVQPTGIEADSHRFDGLFYIADTGTKYGIEFAATKDGDQARKSLGFGDANPEPAPSQIISLLSDGPTLSRKAAMVAHDSLPGDPSGGPVPSASAKPDN